jgi:hypothetical protein
LASKRALHIVLAAMIFEAVVVQVPMAVLAILETLCISLAETAQTYTGWYKMEAIIDLLVDSGLSFLYAFYA